ncbi:MAG: diguanylate cyclase [Lachnospiraceae bacterium]|nr:diguanylate cyclase [Lachnospiraceae bacterium]
MNLVENAVLFDGYRVGTVFDQNSVFTTYLGTKVDGGAPVYIKLLDQSRYTQYDVDKICFSNELPAIKAFDNNHILRVYDAGPVSNTIGIVTEFADFIPLGSFLESRRILEPSVAIDFIMQLADALKYAHGRGIIHRNIKAGAIGVCPSADEGKPESYTLKLFDFGVSYITDFSNIPSAQVDEEFGFMAPEVAGLLNRKVDARSDLYSLGVLFYRFVTGSYPFHAGTIDSMVYQHVAIVPRTPDKLNPSVSEEISRIILKLLAKDPDQRYQTAEDLIYDLDLYLNSNIPTEGAVSSDLITDLDKNARVFSCKYELADLRQSYAIAFENEGRFCLVTGSKGCGKSDLLTSLANELKSSGISFYRAHFTRQTMGTPYHGFREILKAFLDEYDKSLRFLKGSDRGRFPNDVVRHSDLVTNIFPEAKDVFADYARAGEVGESAPLESYKELQRTLRILAEFFLSLTSNKPYVLIFDDIHFIDAASLSLLSEMLEHITSHKVFVVCSCRNERLSENPQLEEFVSRFSTEKQPQLIRLLPFDRERMREFICDLLIVSPSQSEDLVDYIMQITDGNPYFASNVIRSLLEENIIAVKAGSLEMDLKLLRNVTDKNEDIFKIIRQRMDRLPKMGLEALKQAAVIGDTFSLELLSKVMDLDSEKLSSILDSAIRLQFIDCSSTAQVYEFSHRDIHSAFLQLVSDSEQKEIHLKIARSIEALNHGQPRDVYRLVYHYTQAGSDEDVYRFIMEAAALAKYSYATTEALAYYNQALKLITAREEEGSENWCITMDSLIDLNLSAGNSTLAIELANSLLNYLDDPFTIAKLYYRIGVAYYRISNYWKCEEYYLKALESLGIHFNPKAASSLVSTPVQKIVLMFRRLTSNPTKLKPVEKDDMRTPKLIAKVFESLCWTYAFYDSKAYDNCVLRMFNYVQRNLGASAELGLAMIGLSLYLTRRKKLKRSEEFENLGLQMIRDTGDIYSLAKGLQLVGMHYQARGEVYKSIKALKEACEGFENVGDHWQLNNASIYLSHSYQMAGQYDKALALCRECEGTSIHLNDMFSLSMTYSYMMACFIESGDYAEANSAAMKCEAVVERMTLNYPAVAFAFEIGRLKLEEGKYADAITHLTRAKEIIDKHGLTGRYKESVYAYLAIALVKKLDRDRNSLTVTEIQNQEFVISNICDKIKKRSKRASSSIVAARAEAMLGILTGHYKTCEHAYKQGNILTSSNQYYYENAMINFEYSQYLLSKHKLIEARFFVFEAYMIFSHISSNIHMKDCEKIISERYQEAFSSSPLLMSIMERHNRMNADRRINTLLRLGAVLTSTLNDVDLQRQILQEAVELVGAERGILFLYPETGEKKLYVASVYNLGSFDSNTYDWMLEEVERSQKPIVINDVQSDEFRKHYPVMARYGIKSVMAMPMILRGDLFGVIYLDSRLVRQIFSDEYVEALDFIAKQGASPIQNARLYQRAITDGLTGIFGRSYLDNRVSDLTSKEDSNLAAIMIDVDNFKRCNDTYGHPFGDKVLRTIAGIMKRVVGDAGVVCRYGGEEFVALLYSNNETAATAIAEKIRTSVERTGIAYTSTESVNVTISLGVSLWDHSMERLDLIEHADQAVYYSKTHGKNQYTLWTPDMADK